MARASKKAINARADLGKPSATATRHAFQLEFDGSETTKTLDFGWKPYAVYLDGLRQFEGPGNDYTVTQDGFKYSVVWAVAPANTSACHIDAERQT